MGKKEKYDSIAQECRVYEPIQTVVNLATIYDEAEVEDAGCDSCLHFNNGECEIYQSKGNR